MRNLIKFIIVVECVLLLLVSSCLGVDNIGPIYLGRSFDFSIHDEENNQIDSLSRFAKPTVWMDPWLHLLREDYSYPGNAIQKFEFSLGSEWMDVTGRFNEVQAVEKGTRLKEDMIELELPGPGTYTINARATLWNGELLYPNNSFTLTVLPAPDAAE